MNSVLIAVACVLGSLVAEVAFLYWRLRKALRWLLSDVVAPWMSELGITPGGDGQQR